MNFAGYDLEAGRNCLPAANNECDMPKIMVIDDDRQFCGLMKKMLELDGYEVIATSDLAQAREYLMHDLPDVVCCDLKMPGASGLDFLSRRGEIDGLVDVPFVAITGNYSHASQTQAAELGVFAYLTKPFKPSELTSVIRLALASTSLG